MRRRTTLAAIIACLLSSTAQAALFEGWVSAVASGDSISVITKDDKRIDIRIAGIDAPELSQEYGKDSRQVLSSLILNKIVLVRPVASTGESSILAQIARDDEDIAIKLTERGYAWAYPTHAGYLATDWMYAYEAAERSARSRAVGLWQAESPVPPWSWRKLQSDERNAALNKQGQIEEKRLSGVTEQIEEQFGISPEGRDRHKTPTEKKSVWGKVTEFATLVCQWFLALIRTILFLN